MKDEDNCKNLRLMIGKTISDIDFFEDSENAEIKFLMSDGDILSIKAEGDYDLFMTIKTYLSIGD